MHRLKCIYKVKCVSGRVENEFSERYTERAHNVEGEIAPYFKCASSFEEESVQLP